MYYIHASTLSTDIYHVNFTRVSIREEEQSTRYAQDPLIVLVKDMLEYLLIQTCQYVDMDTSFPHPTALQPKQVIIEKYGSHLGKR